MHPLYFWFSVKFMLDGVGQNYLIALTTKISDLFPLSNVKKIVENECFYFSIRHKGRKQGE